MEATSTTSSAASSVDGRSVGGGSDGGYLNLGMFSGTGVSSGNTQQQLQHQQTSELLVGGSNTGYSLANGFGNIASDSNLGNPGSGTSFDLNDFPSLAGGSGSSVVGGSISGSGSGIAAALRVQQQLLAAQQQQQQQQQQQMMHQNNNSINGSKVAGSGNNLYRLAMTNTNGNFNMATEDFPALPGGPTQAGSAGIGNSGILNSSSLLSTSNNASSQRTNANGEGLYVNSIDASTNQLDSGASLLSGTGLSGLGGLRGLQQPSGTLNVSVSRTPSTAPAGTIGSSVAPGSVSSATAGSALSGDYGLLGLLSVIRMTDSDRNALALGSDLSLLGLNLGTTEQIYSTFASPWSDSVATKEPHYQVSYYPWIMF
jgi:CCR4-NOT transcription complex subunit 2